jgi:hypothetical protein
MGPCQSQLFEQLHNHSRVDPDQWPSVVHVQAIIDAKSGPAAAAGAPHAVVCWSGDRARWNLLTLVYTDTCEGFACDM